MRNDDLQLGFSERHRDVAFSVEGRAQKANKVLAVLEDYRGNLSSLTALDIGCSTGHTTRVYATRFKTVVGIDIDEPAIQYAARHSPTPNLQFHVMNSQHITLPSNSFDVVICNHIYEHVPDATTLLNEIHRLLKPNGICYFSAGNRLQLMEPHYRLPFLSVIPKPLAHLYLRAFGRGTYYYETHMTYWALRRLVSRFELIDYTLRVVRRPEKFAANDVLRSGSTKQKLSLAVLTAAYWLCPTYLWVLKKS